jgi:hypothetical protein
MVIVSADHTPEHTHTHTHPDTHTRTHTHTHTQTLVELHSGQVTDPSQRPLLANTQNSQETDIHALGGIRTSNPSK